MVIVFDFGLSGIFVLIQTKFCRLAATMELILAKNSPSPFNPIKQQSSKSSHFSCQEIWWHFLSLIYTIKNTESFIT